MKRIIILGILLLAIAAWRYGSLSRHYVSTQGTISCLHPHEHQSFDYLYTVSGTAYLGTTVPLESGRDFANIKIGDHLTVFYDAKHPEDSTAGSPETRGVMSVWLLIFGGALFSLIVVFWFRDHEPHDESPNEQTILPPNKIR